MNRFPSWIKIACLVGSLLAVALSGGLIGHRLARTQMEARNNPQTWNEQVTREFERLVQPTPDQGPRIQAHLDAAVRELQAIRLDTIARSRGVINQLIVLVEAELTPQQRRAFEAMKPQPAELNLDVLHLPPAPSSPSP
jgi:hypothetical protein